MISASKKILGNPLICSDEVTKYAVEKNLIWIYILLLLFEGALRKWFLPFLSTPLLIVRDPIVMILVYLGIKKNLINNLYVYLSIILTVFEVFLSLFLPHTNIIVCYFGARITLFYFPVIFMIGKVLDKKDAFVIGRLFLYLSIPMTFLVMIQFFSPQTAFVNQGVGGDAEGGGFGGVLDYYRASAIFSFTQGYICFQNVVYAFILIFYSYEDKRKTYGISKRVLLIVFVLYLISIPMSISRTLLVSTIVQSLFWLFSIAKINGGTRKLCLILILLALIIPILMSIEYVQLFIDVLLARFESASDAEGDFVEGSIIDRYGGAFLRAFQIENLPPGGYGIGAGTRVGLKLVNPNLFTDEEWSRIMLESGIYIGTIFVMIRLMLTYILATKSLNKYVNGNVLPSFFLPLTMMFLPFGPFGSTVYLGFAVLIVGLNMCVLNK